MQLIVQHPLAISYHREIRSRDIKRARMQAYDSLYTELI